MIIFARVCEHVAVRDAPSLRAEQQGKCSFSLKSALTFLALSWSLL